MSFIKKMSVACVVACLSSASFAAAPCQTAGQQSWGGKGFINICSNGTLTYTIPAPGGSPACKNGCNSHYPWVVKLQSVSPGILVNVQIFNSPPILDHNANQINPPTCTNAGTSMTCVISQHGVEGGSGGTVVFTNNSQNPVMMSVQ